jgi:sphinganine C4-monooxygenase
LQRQGLTIGGSSRKDSGNWGGQAEMTFVVSDELLGTFVPIAVYWLYSGMYILLDRMEMDDYRLHPKGEEETKNIVSKWTVVKGVLVQQGFQIAVSLILFTVIVLFRFLQVVRKFNQQLQLNFQFKCVRHGSIIASDIHELI